MAALPIAEEVWLSYPLPGNLYLVCGLALVCMCVPGRVAMVDCLPRVSSTGGCRGEAPPQTVCL